MIQIRMMSDSDRDALPRLLKEANVEYSDIKRSGNEFYVVEDQKNLCGLCGYELLENQKAKIDFIFIREQDRGFKLGDGLLRGVLNHLDHLGVKKVLIESNLSTNGFYVAEGLEIVYTSPENSDFLTFVVELPQFFNSPCKGSRG